MQGDPEFPSTTSLSLSYAWHQYLHCTFSHSEGFAKKSVLGILDHPVVQEVDN
jgi:hypothetical protein